MDKKGLLKFCQGFFYGRKYLNDFIDTCDMAHLPHGLLQITQTKSAFSIAGLAMGGNQNA